MSVFHCCHFEILIASLQDTNSFPQHKIPQKLIIPLKPLPPFKPLQFAQLAERWQGNTLGLNVLNSSDES